MTDTAKPRAVICVGDIHGYFTKLQNLWSNLETLINPEDFNTALIIFLGDYCDQGPDTRKVIDFLINLPSKYPDQKHLFLSGNHELPFAAFLGVLPEPRNGESFQEGWREHEESEDREVWYKGEGYEKMHLQGRIWAGKIKVNTAEGMDCKGSIFYVAPTFESYGVPHGSAGSVKLCCSSGNQNISCIEIERKALLKLKESLTDPSGQLLSWAGTDCCSWAGVVCSSRSGNVIKLKLRNANSGDLLLDGSANALGGQISDSLLDLKYLNFLDLSMNNFAEIPIPDFIGSLYKLRYLNLSGASFLGPIPPNLGNLSALRYLDLSSNFLENENDITWLPSLSSLKHLNLGNVNLGKAGTYWLETVNKLPSLVELHLPSCGLSNLPSSLPRLNLTSLSVLDLSQNGFNVSIPSWLFNLSGLVYLDLKSNSLQGEVINEFSRLNLLEYLDLSVNSFISGNLTTAFGKLCSLQVLDLSFNQITGTLDDFIDSLVECTNSSIESMHLGYNNLSGLLPESLGHLRGLKRLYLMQNAFSGSIPYAIGNLSSLQEFNLRDNQMKSSIPVSLGQLSSLSVLEISGNQWEGVVTEAHFSNLSSLQELAILQSESNLTLIFNVSAEWIPPFKLTFLELKACVIGPKFPEWLRNQNMLNYVAVWHANISGTIPDWFWNLDLTLDRLDFSYNQLSGKVPSTIRFREQAVVFLNFNNFSGPLPLFSTNVSSYHLDNNFFSGPIPADFGERMPFLGNLDISFNSLTGEIPPTMANLSYLTTFVLANNKLTGKIPEIWDNMPGLFVFDGSSNMLSGNIPAGLGSLTKLKFLKLSNNKLSGELPFSMQNITLMETLDLGDNQFSGKIPAWIGEMMPSILILSLRANSFTGQIPSNLCDLSSLHILDLAQNRFYGDIPGCIGNLSGMNTVIDSRRYEAQLILRLKGRLAFYDGTLYLVNSIDLSSNNLSGNIPKNVTVLSRLNTLNLSMNHFTGEIPDNIGNLRWLETFDLSSNDLSGTIPPSMASITSLSHLNLSYNNLSGRIPTANQFQTLNDPSIYRGNLALCGQPLPTKCSGDEEDATDETIPGNNKDEDDGDEHERLWLFVSIGLGFIMGFWGVCGTLIIKKSWRQAYFRFIDDKKDWLIVAFKVKSAHIGRIFNQKQRHI